MSADGLLLQQELEEELERNAEAVEAMRASGRAVAEAHRQFREARAVERARLRADGCAVGDVHDRMFANPDVSRKAYLYEFAQNDHDADVAWEYHTRRRVDVIREQLQADRHAAGWER